MKSLRVKVIKIKGYCPIYSPDAEFKILDGYKLCAEREICMHALASLLPWYLALSRGVPPKELGLGDQVVAYIQCPDPCEYTGGGTVVFEVRSVDDK